MNEREIVLVHSPLVGVSSMEPTARALERLGHKVVAPSPYRDAVQPAWRDWPGALATRLPALERPVFVGHSMGSLLAARLAADHADCAVVCLDGDIPPASGPVEPVAPSFRAILDNLPDDNGLLPPWHRWWPQGIFGDREVDDTLVEQMTRDIPSLRRDWFDDTFDMPTWSRATKGFVRLDAWFEAQAGKARSLGWSTVAVDGIHLYPTIAPKETAAAIVRCIEGMAGDRK